MDQSPNDLGSKDGPIAAEPVESCNNNPKISGDMSKLEIKPGISLESAKSNSNRPISPLAKKNAQMPTVSTTPLAAKSKIPAMKRQSTTNLALKNKTSPQTAATTAGATKKTDSRISLGTQNSTSNKTGASFSKTNLAAKAALNSSKLKGLPKPPVTGLKSPGIQRRTDSNMSRRSTSSATKSEPETGNLRKITSTAGDQNKMDILEKKLIDIQTEFLKHHETLKDVNPTEKFHKEYKFITMIRNDACKLMIKDDHLRKLPQKLPANSVGDFKEKIKLNLTEHIMAIMRDFKEFSENPEDQENRLKEIKDAATNNIFELIDDLCASYKEDTNDTQQQMAKVQKDLQEAKKSLKLAETKLIDVNKEHEEKIAKLESNWKTKAAEELSRKEGQIKDLQKKIKLLEKETVILKTTIHDCEKEDLMENKNLQEELKSCRESLNATQKKLSTSEQLLSNERKDIKSKNEIIKKLESELEDLNIKMGDMKTKHKTDNKSPEYLRQIAELRSTVVGLENEKTALEKKIEKLTSEISSDNDVRLKLRDAQQQLENLQQKLSDSGEGQTETKPECCKDAQMELAKLRQSESEKRREIEKLKMVLSKSLFNIEQLQGQIQRDQQLLEVRCELINSLQTNDKSQRLQIEELFAQVGEKTSAVNEVKLNDELRSKSDEYRDMYSVINAKQLELSNQTHIIKLLEESNERCQMLRVKQEEKIARMEQDIAHLKQTIAIYQANILSGNPKLVYPPIMPRLHEDYNQNFYYYTSERKRKRQVDINVKTYEA